MFNFKAEHLPLIPETPKLGTEVYILDFNSTVEIVFQGTNLVFATDHPIHLHGHNFYIVGTGPGNFDPKRDPLGYNLVDRPYRNTVVVPKIGWSPIRFQAHNPGKQN